MWTWYVKSSIVWTWYFVTPCKGFRILESGKFHLWNPEAWDLDSGMQLKEPEILLTIGTLNPNSTEKESRIQNLEFGIHGVITRFQVWSWIPSHLLTHLSSKFLDHDHLYKKILDYKQPSQQAGEFHYNINTQYAFKHRETGNCSWGGEAFQPKLFIILIKLIWL